MSRHDIRLRRQTFTSQYSSKHKNYGDILEKHKKLNRLKIYMQLLLVIVMVSIIIGITYISMPDKNPKEKQNNGAHVK